MNTITALESLGYVFTVTGDRIRYEISRTLPKADLVRPLLAELKERKSEAIEFLHGRYSSELETAILEWLESKGYEPTFNEQGHIVAG